MPVFRHGLRRTAVATLAPALAGLLAASRPVEAQTRRVERAAFAVDLPDWEVVADEGRAGLGKYKVAADSGKRTAEITWHGGEPSSLDEMREMALALFEGTGIQGEIVAQSDLANRYQITADGNIKGEAWLRTTLLTCRKTGVLLTLGFVDRDAAGVKRSHDAALASLECRGEGPEGFEGTLEPTSTLGAEFGFARLGETMVLADAAGRTVGIVGGPVDTVRAARSQPALIARIFGNLLGFALALEGRPAESVTPSGSVAIVIPARDAEGGPPVVLATLPCERSGQGYFLFAFDEAGQAGRVELAALLRRVDCPDSGAPRYSERKSACAVGAGDYCP